MATTISAAKMEASRGRDAFVSRRTVCLFGPGKGRIMETRRHIYFIPYLGILFESQTMFMFGIVDLGV